MKHQKKLYSEKWKLRSREEIFQRTTHHLETKLQEHATHTKNIIEDGNLYTESLEHIVKEFTRNLKRIGKMKIQYIWLKFSKINKKRNFNLAIQVESVNSDCSRGTQI